MKDIITRKKWIESENNILMNALHENLKLSEISYMLPSRTHDAIIRRAQTFQYAAHKNSNGEIHFSFGIKRRSGKTKECKSIEAHSADFVNIVEDFTKPIMQCVASNNIVNTSIANTALLQSVSKTVYEQCSEHDAILNALDTLKYGKYPLTLLGIEFLVKLQLTNSVLEEIE